MSGTLLLSVLVAMTAVNGVGAVDGADQAFEKLAARYLDRAPALSPVGATQLGDHRFDHLLDQVSAAQRATEVDFLLSSLTDLGRIEVGALSRANQVDAALLRRELEGQLWRLETLQEWAWNPLVYTGTAGGAVYGLLAREFAPLPERLAAAAARLEQLPRFLGQARGTLVPARVPRIHAETAVQQNRGVLSVVDAMIVPHLDGLEPALRARLERAIAGARTAVEEHQKWLESTLLPAAQGDFRLGAARFDAKLAFALDSDLDRGEVVKRARAEFARVRADMYEVSKQVYAAQYPHTEFPEQPDEAYRQAIVRAALELAYAKLPPADRLVEVATAMVEEATAFVDEKQLVTVPPDPVRVIAMPEFQRGVSVAYCDSPGPLDVGQSTFYAVAPLPADWSDEQVRSFLREYNVYSMQDLSMHEAMPGHFLQLAHANRYPSTLRAVLSSGTFIEGWAVYAERLMVDAGYQGGDPLQRLIMLKWYLRAVTNAILDQSIHCEGMTEAEAMRLMIEGAFQEEREAAGKWTRARLTSAQLSTYFVGYQEHADLRREIERTWGGGFTLKRYHDSLLSFGSPPVRFVRALMLDLPIPAARPVRAADRRQ